MAGQSQYQLFETAVGVAGIGWTDAGITALRLPAATAPEAARAMLRRLPDAVRAPPRDEIVAVIDAVVR